MKRVWRTIKILIGMIGLVLIGVGWILLLHSLSPLWFGVVALGVMIAGAWYLAKDSP